MQPIIRNLLPPPFNIDKPSEQLADCDNCSMCPPKSGASEHEKYFSPNTKCCTLYPILPNYLVGAILEDPATPKQTRQEMTNAIENKTAYPHGLFPTNDYILDFDARKVDAFGKDESLKCPYYINDGGLCGIFPHWNSTCSTYHCRYEAGKDGKALWDASREYLVDAENTLAKYCLKELGFSDTIINSKDADHQLAVLAAKTGKSMTHAESWATWNGSEISLYKECAKIVRTLDANTLKTLMGANGKEREQDLQAAIAQLKNPTIPARLKMNDTLIIEWEDAAKTNAIMHARSPIRVPAIVIAIIGLFDTTRDNETVIKTAKTQYNADLDPEFITYLYRHDVLADAKNE